MLLQEAKDLWLSEKMHSDEHGGRYLSGAATISCSFLCHSLRDILVPVSKFLFHTLLFLDLSADTTPSPKVTQIQGAFYTGKKYQISPKVDLTERMGMNSRGHSSFCVTHR